MPWTRDAIPDQHGRIAVITGANSGIGFEAALALAAKGAQVVLACRSKDKAEAAMAKIREQVPDATLDFQQLDLASQKNVRAAAASLKQRFPRIDLLINNAGVMWLPQGLTEDGYEQQFGTNHLGHFTLTLLLRDCFTQVPDARVVTVSSLAHRGGKIDFDNPTLAGKYGRHRAYCQSKLANLMFAMDLERRLREVGAEAISVACHPGGSNTNLVEPGVAADTPFGLGAITRFFWGLVTQSAEKGALPTLYAATAADVRGGQYFGPDGPFEAVGYPKLAHARRYALDKSKAAQLWQLSERLTGNSW